MNSVSPIFTVHDEVGRASVADLHALLAHIQPDVIFLEVPADAFADHYVTHSRNNLESRAVIKYQRDHQVVLVPVDSSTPEREFFEDIESLGLKVRAESPLYRQLMSQNSALLSAHGFGYLNSDHCSRLWSAVNHEMQETIERLGDSRLMDIFRLWTATNHRRESIMMDNIEAYCRENTFDKGVFLVGAAHRQQIIDQSKARSANTAARVRWVFVDSENSSAA